MPVLNIGQHYGKRDIERIGIFAEMEYLHGKGYTPPIILTDVRDFKNSQMYPGYPKWKTGLQDCYFDKQFKRVFAKEGWSTEFSRRLKEEMEMKKKFPLARPFMPPSYPKKPGCPGDYFCTLGGHVPAFSPVKKDIFGKKKKGEAQIIMGMKTSPGKKGGPGFADICINQYPQYKSDPYDPQKGILKKKERLGVFLGGFHPNYFDKNPYFTKKITGPIYRKEPFKKDIIGEFYPSPIGKKLGGCKAGCFSEFPQYKPDGPVKLGVVSQKFKKGKETPQMPFMPQARNKTMYITSVMANKVDISMNAKNWRTFQPITYGQEFFTPQEHC